MHYFTVLVLLGVVVSVKCYYKMHGRSAVNVVDLIKSELMGIRPRKEQGSSIYIKCPYHNEKTPSFGINVDPASRKAPLGWGYCFGCGASKNWNQIADTLGLKKAKGMKKDGTFAQDYVAPLQQELRGQLLDGSGGLTLEDLEKEWGCLLSYKMEKNDSWRDYSGKLLRKIGCYVSVDNYDNKCLLMPVIVEGEMVGAQKALWEKSKKKKFSSYLNYSGPWIKYQGLFPYDYVERMLVKKNLKHVVLVEGARDALRLITRGVPALAILGTKNWSDQKRSLVLSLPITKVFLMFDADAAGVQARRDVKADIEKLIQTGVFKLDKIQTEIEEKRGKKFKDSWDPGNIPDKYLDKILEKLH